jgi:hypothetical protein
MEVKNFTDSYANVLRDLRKWLNDYQNIVIISPLRAGNVI